MLTKIPVKWIKKEATADTLLCPLPPHIQVLYNPLLLSVGRTCETCFYPADYGKMPPHDQIVFYIKSEVTFADIIRAPNQLI